MLKMLKQPAKFEYLIVFVHFECKDLHNAPLVVGPSPEQSPSGCCDAAYASSQFFKAAKLLSVLIQLDITRLARLPFLAED